MNSDGESSDDTAENSPCTPFSINSGSSSNNADLDAEGLALLREIFPEQSDDELLRLHRRRIHQNAANHKSNQTANEAHSELGQKQNGCNEGPPRQEHAPLPDDFLRLPKEVAIRRFNEARGEWEYHLIADMQRRVLKQHHSHFEIVGSCDPVDETLCYSRVVERDPEQGLGMTLCEHAGCIWVHSLVGDHNNQHHLTAPESETEGIALRCGIRTGDRLLGVQGQALLPTHNGGDLLTYAVSAIRDIPNPVVLHLEHFDSHPVVRQSEQQSPLRSGPSLLDTTVDTIDASFVTEALDSDVGVGDITEDLFVSRIHPFITALVAKGLIKSYEDQLEATERLQMYTNRTRQWESTSSFRIEAETFRLRHHFDPRDLPPPFSFELPFDNDDDNIPSYAPSTPFLDPKVDKIPPHCMDDDTGRILDDERYDADFDVASHSPSSRPSVGSYPGNRRGYQERVALGESDIFIPLLGVRKALCVRILSTFFEEKRTAYTIWVYDVETGREWYAPVRYLQDFQDLRSSTLPLCPSIAGIPFPAVPGWIAFGKGNKTESESARDNKCRQLEHFLRRLCTMIYTDPLHPASAEIAIHVQSFLGCDIGLSEMPDPHLRLQNQVVMNEGASGQNVDNGHSDHQMRVRALFKRSIQRYTYRLFLLDCVKRVVNDFVDTVRANGPRLEDIEALQAKGRNILKEKAITELEKIQTFLDQMQGLIIDGCMPDFESMARRPDFHAIRVFMNGTKGATYLDRLVRESVREQVEIEVYVPLRGVVSRLLVNGWRHDDIEMQFKVQELRKRPQSFFKIPRKEQSPSDWISVSRIMKEGIGMSTLPCAKLRAIVDAAKEITRLYIQEHGDDGPMESIQEEDSDDGEEDKPRSRSSALSADDFLPIFIFAVVRAELERPTALCMLLLTLCDRTSRIGEIGYFLASFEAAITHIQELDLTFDKELPIPVSSDHLTANNRRNTS